MRPTFVEIPQGGGKANHRFASRLKRLSNGSKNRDTSTRVIQTSVDPDKQRQGNVYLGLNLLGALGLDVEPYHRLSITMC